MIFEPLSLAGAYTIDLEPVRDTRGFNARAWCPDEFELFGLSTRVAQVNVIRNGPCGTLRGFHYQVPPMAEAKLFRVTRGSIYDVIIDLRPESPTYLEWLSVELRADRYRMLYVPERFAQAFQTLEPDTELTYQVSKAYSPQHGRGIRYDDPTFAVEWPLPVSEISKKDISWPDFREEAA